MKEGALNMILLYQGKTKDVFSLENGNYLLKFKDDVTGEDGKFDPGANTIGLTIEGAGKAGLKMTAYFFEILKNKNIFTHFVNADIENNTMEVLPATVFGKGLEVICRFRAVGSFIKRYGDYIESGSPLPAYVETTLKNDEKGDPLINSDALAALNILSLDEYNDLSKMTKEISTIIKDELAKLNMELYDIKLEFGRVNGKVCLIDEISGGNMRVFKNGEYMEPLKLSAEILKNI